MGQVAPFILLDDARVDGAAPAHLYENPGRVFVAQRAEDVAAVLAEADAARRASGGSLAGYINGVSAYQDKQKGNYFDLSATSYNYITGTYVAFGNANSNKSANLTKTIVFRVYAEQDGKPGAILGSVEKTLSEVRNDVKNNAFTEISLLDF